MTLFKHQEEGIDFLDRTPRAALFDEPGLGKSLQALTVAVEPVLVVAPAMVLQGGVWDDEIAKWAPGADVTQVPYSQLPAAAMEANENGKMVRRIKPKLDVRWRRRWGTIIFDEAHYLKGRSTNWTLAAKKLQSERTILLTGTPIPNWAHEAYTLLQLIYPELAKPGGELGSYWRWVEQFFTVGELYGKGGRVISQHHIGGLLPKWDWQRFNAVTWGDRAIRRLRADCLDLPPLIQQTVYVDMKPAQRKAYKEMRDDFVTWLDSGEELAAWSSGGAMVKLAQLASGVEVAIEGAKPCSSKLDALETLVQDRDRPTLVVAHFRSTIREATERLRKLKRTVGVIHGGISGPNRGKAVRDFQEGRTNTLVATIDTIAEGLTFTNCDQVVFLERSWRPSKNEQTVRRIHRIGQVRPVTSIHLVTRGTVDERVIELLASKTDQQMQALAPIELRSLVA